MSLQTSPRLFFVSALACAIRAGALAAETPPAPKPATNAETGSKDKPPLIVHNSDGSMTVQKEAGSGKSKDGKRKGLVIPLNEARF
jgi:hypothetical protein